MSSYRPEKGMSRYDKWLSGYLSIMIVVEGTLLYLIFIDVIPLLPR